MSHPASHSTSPWPPVALLAALAACAAPAPRTPFPSRPDVDALAARPVAPNPFAFPIVDVPEWEFAEVRAARIDDAPAEGSSAAGAVAAEVAAREPSRLRATRAMRCAAEEIARFYAEHRAGPSMPLRTRMLAHCGGAVGEPTPFFLFGDVNEGETDAQVVARWWPTARAQVPAMLGDGRRNLGAGFARSRGFGVLAFLSAEQRVALDPLLPVVDERGVLLIRGRSLVPVEHMSAMINRGRYGYADCRSDDRLELPEFAFACELEEGDLEARVQVAVFEPGRVLGREALDLVALRRPDSGRSHRAEPFAAEAETPDAASFSARLLELVNAVRAGAGLAPVVLSQEQSRTAERLAPRFFQAQAGRDSPEVLDSIVLGLSAGWDVGGAIRRGSVTACALGPTLDAAQWLAAALDAPAGREVLLDPESRVIALGPLVTREPPVLGALVSAYTFFDGDDHAADVERVLERIRAARTGLGFEAPQRLRAIDADTEAHAREVQSGDATPAVALSNLMNAGVRSLQRSVRGMYVETHDLGDFPIPRELLGPGPLELSIAVTHYQPADSPWARYVVLVVIGGPRPFA